MKLRTLMTLITAGGAGGAGLMLYVAGDAIWRGEFTLSSRYYHPVVIPRAVLPWIYWGLVSFFAAAGVFFVWLSFYLARGISSVNE
nr:hypothetical protein [Variovorax boronicumulans]